MLVGRALKTFLFNPLQLKLDKNLVFLPIIMDYTIQIDKYETDLGTQVVLFIT